MNASHGITIVTLPNGATIETTSGEAIAAVLALLATPTAVSPTVKAPTAPKAPMASAVVVPGESAPTVKAPKAPKAPTVAKADRKAHNQAILANVRTLCAAGDFVAARAATPPTWVSTLDEVARRESAPTKAPKVTKAKTAKAPTKSAPKSTATTGEGEPVNVTTKATKAKIAKANAIAADAADDAATLGTVADVAKAEAAALAPVKMSDAGVVALRAAMAPKVALLIATGSADKLATGYAELAEQQLVLERLAEDMAAAGKTAREAVAYAKASVMGEAMTALHEAREALTVKA
jgi:hypothetical protein